MKYIIVGLGNFGSSLATKLTSQGHEVIGIDIDMDKVERYKESISHTICIDSTSENAVSGLPIAQTDVVLITIGEDQGQNVMVTALFKISMPNISLAERLTHCMKKYYKHWGLMISSNLKTRRQPTGQKNSP